MTRDRLDPGSATRSDFAGAPTHGEDTQAEALQRAFVAIYKELLASLEGPLGSRDAALDALQDASLKLASEPEIGPVRNPYAYLRRMALNLGRNRRRAVARFVPVDKTWLDAIADEEPDPERIAAARADLASTVAALDELPERRRLVFLDKWMHGLSLDEIARSRGIHRRTVQKELERTAAFLRARAAQSP
ncbi:RNA polymerase sigma-70 factor (ECF subfamily) [Novosphingobium sp. PhB165]|uniref:RNA polymerase sigma factor n=1 Tax=Novosphingobium sp. PhB165 TaxID=2485105 RepID=UPI001050682A|nr:sigma-70 family RNA polymerase sigma factor [Novosphingobium sp. PhB165]TCM13977.1 RNA polymerase sigma-70 factor (ECF subfamily) [Novosphingobium sp. PhB165]